MNKNSFDVYDQFHKEINLQTRIIEEKNFTYRNIISILETLMINKNNILDIGCGAGTIDFYLANKCHEVLGIDISKNAIRACNESKEKLNLGRNINFIRLNFPKKIPNKVFDFVICSEVLEHLENDEKVIKTISSLLRKGGKLLFSVPSKNAPIYKIGLLQNYDKRVGHLRRYTAEELLNLIINEGFLIEKVVKTEGMLRNFLFFNDLGIIPLKLANRFEFFSDLFTFLDNITLKLFGESQIIVVAQKPAKEERS